MNGIIRILHKAASAASSRHCNSRQQRRYYNRCLISAASSSSSSHHLSSAASSVAPSSSTYQSSKANKKLSFIDEVNEQMKQDYPEQYERYLESKRAYEVRKEVRAQNDKARLRRLSNAMLPEDELDTIDEVLLQKTQPTEIGSDEVCSNKTLLHSEQAAIEIPWYKKIEQQTGSGQTQSTDNDFTTKFSSGKDPAITFNIDNATDNSNITSMTQKSSIFSNISKSALSFKDGDKSTTIPLSELFPTLYAKEIASTSSSTASSKNKVTPDPRLMYDPKQFDAYREAMVAVMTNEKMQRTISKFEKKGEANIQLIEKLKEWVLKDHRIIDEETLGNRWRKLEKHWREGWSVGGALSLMTEKGNDGGDDDAVDTNNVMKDELKKQNELFQLQLFNQKEELEAQGDMTNTVEGHEYQAFNQLAQLLFTALGRYCAERARSVPMEVAWYKVKESGLMLPKDTISTYLYVVGTMGMGDSFRMTSPSSTSVGKEQSQTKKENRQSISEEVATYHDLAMKPTESSISLRVKAFATKGDARSALDLLEAFEETIGNDSKEAIRLRTYLPILKKYCEVNDISAALKVFKQMQATSTVILEPENYVLLLASIAANGFFCDNSSPIEGALDLGLQHASGPELFDELLSEMADDVLEISSASASRLHNALAIGFKEQPKKNNLKEMHPLASMPLSQNPADSNELVACKIALDRSNGICPVTNAQQRLIVLEPSQRRQLHDDLLKLSREQFAKYVGRRQDESVDRATEELQKFSDWLDERDGEPFTAIVDGANIAYYMQSFDKGRFNYHQIKFMVDTLEERGETVLVVIPHKYGYNEFYTSNKSNHQTLDAEERTIMNDLLRKKKLYKVPPRCLDDLYWMLASVSDQSASRKGADLSVSNDDPNGRWPGVRPVLISNDQMRDHKWELLEPRLFRRWYGCHIVNYNFTAFVMGECVEGNEIFFSQADFFSREIQGNQTLEGKAWHFPVSDWDLEERFVVRL